MQKKLAPICTPRFLKIFEKLAPNLAATVSCLTEDTREEKVSFAEASEIVTRMEKESKKDPHIKYDEKKFKELKNEIKEGINLRRLKQMATLCCTNKEKPKYDINDIDILNEINEIFIRSRDKRNRTKMINQKYGFSTGGLPSDRRLLERAIQKAYLIPVKKLQEAALQNPEDGTDLPLDRSTLLGMRINDPSFVF